MRWRIYYGDGSTYSSKDGPPAWAPKQNVQVIAQESAASPRLGKIHSKDYYAWRDDGGGWYGMNDSGFWEYMFEPGPKIVVFGRTMPHSAEFHECVRRANLEGVE